MGYFDADLAGDKENRKSMSSYRFQFASGPMSWRGKKLDTVALSTAN